jgi:hypothetical protein
LERPPPGVGLKTVMVSTCGTLIKMSLTVAVSCVALIKLVTRLFPFHLINELLLKFCPLTVSVKLGSPAVALLGVMVVILGTGLPPLSKGDFFLQEKNKGIKRNRMNFNFMAMQLILKKRVNINVSKLSPSGSMPTKC